MELPKHSDKGDWVAPGGSIDPNETPADAAMREMWEETGLLVEPVQVLGVYGGPEFEIGYKNGERVSYVMTVFQCQIIAGQAKTWDNDEILAIQYFAETELATLNLSIWAKIVLADAFNRQHQTNFKKRSWQPPIDS